MSLQPASTGNTFNAGLVTSITPIYRPTAYLNYLNQLYDNDSQYNI